jgi:amino acid permease
MDFEKAETGDIDGEQRRRHRKRRAFCKRRQFWIALFAVIFAIILVLWLISNLSIHRGEMD